VCVRLVRMNDVDLALFQFDYDLTWMGFFLDANNRIYSRYGGRDAQSDEGRLSIDGLKVTMRRVLDLHRQAQRTKTEPPAPHKPKLPRDLFPVQENSCLHCHQVWEGLRNRQRKEGTFDPASLYVYPLPENIGLELDVHAGNRVVKVLPDSPASRAKLQPGDELRRIAGEDILAQGDVLWALHNAPAKGPLPIEWMRKEQSLTAVLELPSGWRKTDLSWRQSMIKEEKYLDKEMKYLK
jgi:serine protease Do